MPKLCFVMVLTSCKDFLQIIRIFCHDLTDMSCPRLTPLPVSVLGCIVLNQCVLGQSDTDYLCKYYFLLPIN